MSEIGHNSGGDSYRVTAAELTAFVQRIENIQDEISVASESMKEVFAEAKGRGYDTKILRKLIALRKRSNSDIREEQAVLAMYGQALGMDIFS